MKILFIPVSGPRGAGEYIRSLTIAQKLDQSLEEAEIKFVLNRNAKYIDDVPFPTRLIDGTPTLNVEPVKQIISEEKPDLCIFDSGGRTSLLSFLKKKGIPVVYVSSRNNTRKKAFRLRWLKLINQHWVVQPTFANGPLSFIEKLKLKVTKARPPEFLQTVFPESDEERRKNFKNEIGLGDHKYMLFSSGGGGQRGDGDQAPDIFASAAKTVADKTGLKCVALMGPNYPNAAPEIPGVITLKSVSNFNFIDLLHDAEIAVVGGGSSLAQGMAERKIIVCAPAAADQAKRIDAANATGTVISVDTKATDISNAVLDIYGSPEKQAKKLVAIDDLGLCNGITRVPDLVTAILSGKSHD